LIGRNEEVGVARKNLPGLSASIPLAEEMA